MTRACASLVFAVSLFAQPPSFQASDIHPSVHPENRRMTGGALAGDRYALRNASLLDLIRAAYGIDDRLTIGADDNRRIAGGPSWLDLDRFDLIAKTAPGTPRDEIQRMLQTLLADRFKLAVHMDTRPMPGYVLTLGSGKPKMKEADPSGKSGCQSSPNESFHYVCRNITMSDFAPTLRGLSYALNNPVVDETGLKGAWDFELRWGGQEVSIFDAVDQQMGLRLQLQKIPRSVIMVDRVERKPTPNPPGIAALLPPPPPSRFEVAVIKPSMPGVQQRRRIDANGRFNLQAFTLKNMITLAWNINSDQLLAGTPKFADETRFDVTAEASTGPADTAPIDLDDYRTMLRALLQERFKLAAHTEDRPADAYRLVGSKPKLQKADPANRTGCHEGPGEDGKDPRVATPWLARLVTCENITLAQFAEQIPSFAGGYVNAPVSDGTGIRGEFDLTVNFSPMGLVQGANQSAATGGASDPSGLLSLSDALSKQLGLSLKTEKRNLPVLVIDHLEPQPTDN